jgi:MoaA/NifB/PqqE/SkfB family radical SAM enzyme
MATTSVSSHGVIAIKTRLGSDGIHIFDRRSGVNILFDEIHVPVEDYSRAPRFVSFALTNACDLDCAFCYAPKHAAKLDFDQIVRWARQLDENGALGIGFGGGEPTLYPRFSELCATLTGTTELAISFTTHAHRMTPRLRDELVGAVHYIRVSMDGLGITYEQIRRRSFARFLQQVQIVSDTCAFGVNYVVNDATVAQLDEAANLVFGLGATEMLLLPEVSNRGLRASTQKVLLDWVRANSGQLRLAISEIGVTDGIPIADPFVAEKGTKAYIHVNASGKVSRTSYNQDGATTIKTDDGILTAIANYERESP